MKLKILIGLAIAAVFGSHATAQNYDTNGDYVQTFAGSGFSGYLDGQGTQTMFSYPSTIVADTSANLFVLDGGRIRKIAPDATVSTFAGGGNVFPGYGTNASLGPASNWGQLAIDHSNTIWTTQTFISTNGLLRVGRDGYVSWFPLTALNWVNSSKDGVCVDSGNNVYISDNFGNIIYRYRTNGVLEVFAGSGNAGAVDGNGVFSSFSAPSTLAADTADNIYVWDSGNYLIRRINQNRDVTTIAGRKGISFSADGVGTNATFSSIYQMCLDSFGNLLIASGSCIRKVSATTNAVTVAGSFTQTGYAEGLTNIARFNNAEGVCVSDGTIFVADTSNYRIRDITNNPTPQVISGANLAIKNYAGVSITGIVGRTYQIQASPDMNSWSTITTVLLNSSPYLWFDQNPVNGNKFYRAVLMP